MSSVNIGPTVAGPAVPAPAPLYSVAIFLFYKPFAESCNLFVSFVYTYTLSLRYTSCGQLEI